MPVHPEFWSQLERLIRGNSGAEVAGEPEPEPEPEPEVPPPPPGLWPVVYVVLADGELHRVRAERFVIGRGKHCDLHSASSKLSREHAVVTRDGGNFLIEDLNSSNGTWVGSQRVKRRVLCDGDVVKVADIPLKFVFR